VDCARGAPTHKPIERLAWHPSRPLVAAASWEDVVLWDVSTMQAAGRIATPGIAGAREASSTR
jgi:hypothetical protein